MGSLNRILKIYLDENQIDFFHVKGLKKEFYSFNERDFDQALRDIISIEYSKLENGKYLRNTFKNEYVIGNFLTGDGVISYWSALNIHGITEQFPNKVFVQTTKQKKNKEVFGVEYQFVKVRAQKMIGSEMLGLGSNQFRISDIEKTIIDCFDLVQYSGGFMELIRAFKRATLNSDKMIEYSQKVGNRAAIKRMGFLAEVIEKKGMKKFINFAKKFKSKNYDLFDIYGLNKGDYIANWNLKLNIEKSEIIEIANSIY